jgi:DNA (cytosine-5)-methyltransferase 1
VAPRPELAALHLCSGYGGFELITRLAGIPARTVAHIERDSHAAAILMARMGEATLDPAPIWDDLTTFKGAAWRGRVDLITAGFPCQPFSAAGEQRGIDDERWIWPDIARIIADVGPRYVFLENVTGLIRHGLPHVLSDLAELGFNAEWGCLAASAVGAPHRRERVWLWATLADPESVRGVQGHRPGTPRQDRRRFTHTGGGAAWPPRRDDPDGWADWTTRGGPQPLLRRSADGATGKLVRPRGHGERLHALGNGLVPQAGASALRQLIARSQR